MQALGPVTASVLARRVSLPPASIESALLALETEGFVLRGRFTDETPDDTLEWCERRLLARIHRRTVRSLRAEIEAVGGTDFLRFLLEWQGVTREARAEGPQTLARVLEQLEGFELPAIAWEADVLDARMDDYDPAWLDALCLAGRVLWVRLDAPRATIAGPVRSTPMALVQRKHAARWGSLARSRAGPPRLSANAQALEAALQAEGACFFDDLLRASRLLPAQAEEALGELVAAGRATADSFAGLRALLMSMQQKRKLSARGSRFARHGLGEAGRWSLVRIPESGGDFAEDIAWTLLRRYGVVHRRLIAREPGWLPPWHELVRIYRRLEAQGHIRGGRFVAGSSGEQYALPDAVTMLRAVRKRAPTGELVILSAADPLNLLGIVTPDAKLAALAGNRFALRDGVVVGVLAAGEVQLTGSPSAEDAWRIQSALKLRTRRRPAATQATSAD